MTGAAPALNERGTTICRGCASSDLHSVIDLGLQPLANEMGSGPDQQLSEFPLHLRICMSCGLGQLGEFVLPDRIFGDRYPYLSSTSASWVRHAREYAARFTAELSLGSGDRVIEIASNDGYLLTGFKAQGIDVLGVEPSRNVAELARAAGVPTRHEFFGRESACQVLADGPPPRLVVANNVLAHVPDLDDFVGGLALLCGIDGLVTVENPSLTNLFAQAQFDTIYHEHFSYLSAHAVDRIARQHGLRLVRVEQLETHGGSNRYWLRHEGSAEPDQSVAEVIGSELEHGLLEPATWERFATTSWQRILDLRSWLDEKADSHTAVAAYGAAAKGNTFLNAVGPVSATIAFAVDASPEKQGMYLPGSRVPVHEPEYLARTPVDDVLVLPWNLAHEIAPLVRSLAPAAGVWVAIPRLERVP